MKTKRVLVTGASGFIGRPLVAALLRVGYVVRAAIRDPMPFPDSVEAVIIPNLKDPIDWSPILRGVDIVIHLAGLVHADKHRIPFTEFDQINWIATGRLANAAKKARVKRFIYISSVRAQVGPSAAQIVRERDRPMPTDHYGRSKLAAEWAIKSVHLPFTILRSVAVYGPHPKGNFRTLVRLASSPWPLPLKGFTARRSLLGIDNLISAIIFAINNQRTLGQTLLVADSVPHTLPEICTMLRQAQGRSPWMIYAPQFYIRHTLNLLGYGHLWERIGSDLVVATTRLESFGWRAPVDTYEGIVTMMRAEDGKAGEKTVLHEAACRSKSQGPCD
jgi:nucleoside-diphosphate-sugar epimerase